MILRASKTADIGKEAPPALQGVLIQAHLEGAFVSMQSHPCAGFIISDRALNRFSEVLLCEPMCVELVLSSSHIQVWADAPAVLPTAVRGAAVLGTGGFGHFFSEWRQRSHETPLGCSGKSALERTQNLQGALFLLLQEMDGFLSVLCVIVTKYHKDILFRMHFIIPNVM